MWLLFGQFLGKVRQLFILSSGLATMKLAQLSLLKSLFFTRWRALIWSIMDSSPPTVDDKNRKVDFGRLKLIIITCGKTGIGRQNKVEQLWYRNSCEANLFHLFHQPLILNNCSIKLCMNGFELGPCGVERKQPPDLKFLLVLLILYHLGQHGTSTPTKELHA